jgi:integrase
MLPNRLGNIHVKNGKLSVTQFINSNGTSAWRVDGYQHGVRIRKNFKTREEAIAEKAALEIQILQSCGGMRQVATVLTEDQVREAEALFKRTEDKPQKPSFYVDFALNNYQEPEHQKSVTDAVTDYVAARTHEYEQKHICRLQLRRIKSEINRLKEHFPKKTVAELAFQTVVAFLEIGRPGMKTYNNRRGILSTYFKYCFQRGWINENPILRVPYYRIRKYRGMAQTLTAAQSQELMEYFETFEGGRWIPYFALCLFAGIRPCALEGEIAKLQPCAINLESGMISITAEVSKVREPRKVVIQPNLAAWLRAYPLDKYPLNVGNFYQRRDKFKKRFSLSHDVLRHTFISMFVGKFRSIGEAAIQAGNSEAIVRKHYLDMKTSAEAEQFFSIVPRHAKTPCQLGDAALPIAA